MPKRYFTALALIALLMLFSLVAYQTGKAQTVAPPTTSTATPYPLPPSNALLIYDPTSVTLINISPAPISLAGLSFERAGGVVSLKVADYGMSNLAPGHCVAWWLSSAKAPANSPPCTTRDRWGVLSRDTSYFWIGGVANEPFRPQLNHSALTICNTSAAQCAFFLPQGSDANHVWVVLDPGSGLPLPPGLQVAYDANQLWIGNLTPGTVLTTIALRLFYPVNGVGQVWTPSKVQWDGLGAWDGRSLSAGQCLVLYKDASKITPLLPCVPIAQSLNVDQPWMLTFEVMGPREERRAACGASKPATGPVLCLLGG